MFPYAEKKFHVTVFLSLSPERMERKKRSPFTTAQHL